MVRSVVAAVGVVGAVILCASLALSAALLHLPRRSIDYIMYTFGCLVLGATGCRITSIVWHGKPTALPPRLVIACNHESHLDGPSILIALRARTLRFVGKQALFRIPLFGWALKATGNVPLTRGDTGRDALSLADPKLLDAAGDIFFFPEGTRSKDGRLGEFKKGAAVTALRTGRPILPVAVAGGFECLPPHSLRPRPGLLAVVIGEPIEVSGMIQGDRHRLRDLIRTRVSVLRQEALRLVGSPRAELTSTSG